MLLQLQEVLWQQNNKNMENKNITTNLLIKQMLQSDAIAYNANYVAKDIDMEFGVLNKAYQDTGREYAQL